MDKRVEANLRVKRRIVDALFSLMREKSLTDIRVTEIIREAGVARASFYRNYCSKEDVLITLIRDVLEDFRKEIRYEQGNFYTYDNLLLSFQFFKQYQNYVLDLYHSGFGMTLLEELNLFHESIEGTMPATSIKKYELYIYIGALFNTALVWLSDEANTSAEGITEFFLNSVSNMVKGRLPDSQVPMEEMTERSGNDGV